MKKLREESTLKINDLIEQNRKKVEDLEKTLLHDKDIALMRQQDANEKEIQKIRDENERMMLQMNE